MWLHIDYNSGEPICRQAVAQIKLMLVNGSLKPGDRLPSIRELSRDLQINPTTVSRIYSELSHEGVIALRQGQGAFVSGSPPRFAAEEVRRLVAKHADALLVEGLRHGLSIEQIRKIVDEEYDAIKGGES